MPRGAVADVYLILVGICIWDFVTSLWFEYRLFTKKIRFRWQFVPYFLTRYVILAYATLHATEVFIDLDTLSPCTRAAFKTQIFFVGFLGMAFSTWNLLTRTIIIWGHHPIVMKLLFATGFLHFVLSLIASFTGRPPCGLLPPSVFSVTVFGTTTATIELAILALSLVGIRRASRHRESSLARLLMAQGVAYFAMVFFLHLSMVIVNCVQPGGIASMCVGVTGATIGPVLSCRLVTSTLTQGSHTDFNPEVRTHCIERLEPPEDQSQNPTTRMTTFIEIQSKDESVVC